jgi:hypothetical protein
MWSIGAFGFLTVAGPYIAFGTFSAKDENGLITLLLGLMAFSWLGFGILIVGISLAAAMRWWRHDDD